MVDWERCDGFVWLRGSKLHDACFVLFLTSGLGVGVLYGTTSVCVGHPFDTIKTKMQAQQGFENRSMLRSFAKTLQEQGIRGLYRGCLPPLFGSGIFRSTQFAVFESVYTYMDVPFGKYEVPLTGGLQVRVDPVCLPLVSANQKG